ncbi:DUF6884 domain-containing protein [Streptomyces anulatus]|uniref:DUF6884 domain-containing protein n=1 Tax=Streptomyces anulatus TaxID=1892 RepID=UPI001C27E48B|nr:DUF6884 domain-containing protein [Streptomyces anulatus]
MTETPSGSLTTLQRAGLHAAALHSGGHLPPCVPIADLVGLVARGLADPVPRQPDGAFTRSPRCLISGRGREHAAREPHPQLILVPCSSAKLDLPLAPAWEMYRGSYHRAALRAAHALAAGGVGTQILVLSAKFGLLQAEDHILHYDLRAGQRGTVTAGVLRRQAHHLAVSGAEVTVLAGKAYATLAREMWPRLRHPLTGSRGIGDHLAFFASLYGPGRQTGPPPGG